MLCYTLCFYLKFMTELDARLETKSPLTLCTRSMQLLKVSPMPPLHMYALSLYGARSLHAVSVSLLYVVTVHVSMSPSYCRGITWLQLCRKTDRLSPVGDFSLFVCSYGTGHAKVLTLQMIHFNGSTTYPGYSALPLGSRRSQQCPMQRDAIRSAFSWGQSSVYYGPASALARLHCFQGNHTRKEEPDVHFAMTWAGP